MVINLFCQVLFICLFSMMPGVLQCTISKLISMISWLLHPTHLLAVTGLSTDIQLTGWVEKFSHHTFLTYSACDPFGISIYFMITAVIFFNTIRSETNHVFLCCHCSWYLCCLDCGTPVTSLLDRVLMHGLYKLLLFYFYNLLIYYCYFYAYL